MKELKNIEYKYNEGAILDELTDYINNTYGEHYVGKNNVQTIDVWESLDIVKQVCQGTAIKYLMRVGKKQGFNRKDLLKAIHFIILLLYFHDKEESNNM